MTYVSRRARITVPRWPNDFDPEFLFRVGRRCDGRLKRHSSCHDLRAWINDNCIKHEYLLDLMSDGEVTITPPLELYGRFIPVPVLFKLLQNSGSANGAENIDWEEFLKGKEAGEDDTKWRQSGSTYPFNTEADDQLKESDDTYPFNIETDDQLKELDDAYPSNMQTASKLKLESETSFEHRGRTWNEYTAIYGGRPNKLKNMAESSQSREAKLQVSSASFRKDRRMESETKSILNLSQSSCKVVRSESIAGEVFEQGVTSAIPSAVEIGRVVSKRKWDPFEKMEYYTSGFASKGAIVDGVHPLPTSTHSALPTIDDYMSKNSRTDTFKSGSEANLTKVLWEKNLIERSLFKSICMLGKALGKLERINGIIEVANEETEIIRKGEIQEAFRKPKFNCICLSNPSGMTAGPIVRYRIRDLARKETIRCNELLRQISGLREKLKKNEECRQKVKQEITLSQKRVETVPSPHMTELYNRERDSQLNRIQKLQKRLERLVNQRGKLLSSMCEALTNLNNLKKSNNSKMILQQKAKLNEYRGPDFRIEQFKCFCKTYHTSDSEKAQCSDSVSSSDDQYGQADGKYNSDQNNYDYSSREIFDSRHQFDKGRPRTADILNEAYASNGELNKDNRQEKEGSRKSILRFYCPEPCRKQLDADLFAFEKYLRSDQHLANQGLLHNNQPYRPSTSPTTKRERLDASEERWCFPSRRNSRENWDIPERRVKSETTMKEIEKTLRNYEQRLTDMDGLEYKVEEWKKRLSEACRWKRKATKIEAQMLKERENEKTHREQSNMEITGLLSENCELKRQVRQLMDKSKEQAKKIQNMKCSVVKVKNLESEAEELKKELSEYRNSYEHQRKCINKWESVVAVQRKEIENLMNHIRKLTTERTKEQVIPYCPDRRCNQRSRSYSPEVQAPECKDLTRPQTCNALSDEENRSCCCQEFRQSERRRCELRIFDKNYFSSLTDRDDWCN